MMSWNPIEARKILDASKDIQRIRMIKKLSGFKMKSGRQLALSEENVSKVTLYIKCAPFNMPDVVVEEEYKPTTKREGRHADLEALTETLGYSEVAFRLHIKSKAGLEKLLDWYTYA